MNFLAYQGYDEGLSIYLALVYLDEMLDDYFSSTAFIGAFGA